MHPVAPTSVQRQFMRGFVLALLGIPGLVTVFVVHQIQVNISLLSPQFISQWQMVILAMIAGGIGVTLVSKLEAFFVWETLFVLTLFLGVWYGLLLVLPLGLALFFASALTLAHLLFRNVAIHNFFFAVGAMGIAIDFAGWFSPDVLIGALVLFSVYDMLAGPPGGPILVLARKLVGQGIVPGFIVPSGWADTVGAVGQVITRESALLGAGDLILPLALIARASFVAVWPGLLLVLGLIVSALVLVRNDMTHPRAALPALSLGVVLPFLVLHFLNIV